MLLRTRNFYLFQATKYNPHSPYSASEASSDHFARAFHDTYSMPTIVTNCSNNLREVAQPMLKNDYGRYLLSILDEGNQTLKKNLEY